MKSLDPLLAGGGNSSVATGSLIALNEQGTPKEAVRGSTPQIGYHVDYHNGEFRCPFLALRVPGVNAHGGPNMEKMADDDKNGLRREFGITEDEHGNVKKGRCCRDTKVRRLKRKKKECRKFDANKAAKWLERNRNNPPTVALEDPMPNTSPQQFGHLTVSVNKSAEDEICSSEDLCPGSYEEKKKPAPSIGTDPPGSGTGTPPGVPPYLLLGGLYNFLVLDFPF